MLITDGTVAFTCGTVPFTPGTVVLARGRRQNGVTIIAVLASSVVLLVE